MNIFETSNEEQVELLKPLLFENQCARITITLADICWNMIKEQNTAGFVQLTTYVEFALNDFKNRFDASDRSNEDLKAFQFETQNTLAPNIVIVQLLGLLVLEGLNIDLQDNIEESLDRNTVVLGLLCTAAVVISLLIYYIIFRKVREADTQFRRVLQVFPANLILSNFNLKSYLIKTTHKRLDFV